MRPVRPLVLVNGLLLLAAATAILGVQRLNRASPAVEQAARQYAAAVNAQDLGAALDQVAPDERAAWQGWVAYQMGNRYDVRAVSVRSPSVLDRLSRHASGEPFEATIVLDVNRGVPGRFYQPTTRVPILQRDGRWYLGLPLLAAEQG